MWDKVLIWPLGVRGLLAVLTVMLAVACVVVPALLGGTHFKRSGELVQTQPRESATLIEVVPLVRGQEIYYVHLDGEDVEMDYGWFIPNPTPGMTIEVVRDPENSSRIIAVGTPQDWADRPWLTCDILAALALVLGLVAALFAGIKLVPERAEPALERLAQTGNRFARWLDETLQTWPGRTLRHLAATVREKILPAVIPNTLTGRPHRPIMRERLVGLGGVNLPASASEVSARSGRGILGSWLPNGDPLNLLLSGAPSMTCGSTTLRSTSRMSSGSRVSGA